MDPIWRSVTPVSQQARADKKAAFHAAIRKETGALDFLLLGDVSVSVEWTVSEQARYETDRTPDVDNILKPLLDALTGPAGVLVDDNQVQNVSCHWIDGFSDDESGIIAIRYSPDEWIDKAGIFFVQIEKALCAVSSKQMPAEFRLKTIEVYVQALQLRADALAKGVQYQSANLVMPIQRLFHRSRLDDFEVVPLATFLAAHAS